MEPHYNWRILLVDDDEDDYFITRTLLAEARQGKFLLEWASSFQAGRDAMRDRDYDAVLIDYDMGAYTGIELIREAAQAGYPAPMLLLTGRGTYEVDMEAMQAGASDYLNKGEINAAFLERTIRYAIERKRTQKQLAEANAQLRARREELKEILASINDGFLALDEHWNFLYINLRAAANGNRSPNELVGKNIWREFPQLQNTEVETRYRRVMETRQPEEFEWEGTPAQPRHYGIKIYPFARGISVFWEDRARQWEDAQALNLANAQLQRQKEALEERNREFGAERAMLRAIVDNAPIAITMVEGPDLRIALINREVEKFLPGSRRNLIGRKIADILKKYQTDYPNILRKIAENGQNVRMREMYSQAAQDRPALWYNLDHIVLPGETEADKRVLIIGEDITEQVRARLALQNEHDLRQAVLEQMPAAVLIIDVQTDRMILGNRQVNHILRYHFSSNANLDELKRFPGFHLDGAPVQPEEWPLWRAMQYGEELQGEELMIVRGDGTQAVLQISAAPVRDAQGTVIAGVMVFTDITERKRAERDVHYLIELGEMINRAASPADLLIEVCQHAVGYLDLSRCLFAEVQPGSGPAVVYREFQQGSSPELAPIAGLFPLEEFHPEIIATLKEGRPVVNRDAQADPRTAPGYDTSTRPAGLRSYIAIPILRGGDWSGVLLACDQRPRNWNDRQVALLQATAERAWTAYENRRLLVELAENEERFRLASRAMDGFVFDYNLITGEIHCSEGFEKITGFVQEALPGIDTWKTRIHAEDLARLEQAPGPQTLAGGGLFEREYRFQRAAGDWIDLREYGMIIRGANERPSRVLGIMADVTRRKSIERALRRSEETARLLADEARLALQKMETVINSMGEAVLLATPEGRLEHANPAAVALHGYHNETEMLRSLDAVYEPFEAFKPEGEPIPREQWPIYRALAGETVINMEMHVRRKDNGRRWIGLVSGIPTYSQRGDVLLVLCTITDITPIRLAEQQRHEMTTRLEVQRLLVAQREQERLQLARDLHDGPIQNLIGLTYTLQNARATSQNPAVHALLEDARKEAQKLVGELRGMCNNLRPPVLIRFGLSKAIQAYAEELRARGAPPLSLHLDDDTGALDDDTRMGLYRIFQECMANVLRHAHAGQVWVRLSIDARAATLEVQDDGAGFTLPDDLLNLARQGHLGLVGMKERAEAIGAVLEIQSAPGAGARLTVRVQRRA